MSRRCRDRDGPRQPYHPRQTRQADFMAQPVIPVLSVFDRFIPNRVAMDLDWAEFSLTNRTNSTHMVNRHRTSTSSTGSDQSMEDDMSIVTSSDGSLSTSRLTSSISSDNLDLDTTDSSFGETNGEDKVLSRQAASLLLGNGERGKRILSFQPRAKRSDLTSSAFPLSAKRAEGGESSGSLEDHRNRFLRDLYPYVVYDLPGVETDSIPPVTRGKLDIHDDEGDIVVAFSNVVSVWDPCCAKFDAVYDPNEEMGVSGEGISCVGWHKNATMIATCTSGVAKNGQGSAYYVTLSNPNSNLRTYYNKVAVQSLPFTVQWTRSGVTCGCRDGGVYHYDDHCGSNKPVLMFQGHDSPILSCQYNRGGNLLATGDWSGHLLIWDRRQPSEPVNRFTKAHAGPIMAMSWCPWQHDLLATGNALAEPTMMFWNLITGLKSKERRVASEISSVQWLEAERELVSSHLMMTQSPDNTILWKYPSLKRSGALQFHTAGVVSLALWNRHSRLVSVSKDGSFCIWNLDPSRQDVTSKNGRRYASFPAANPRKKFRRSPFSLGMLR